ncbi:hypothetical protein HU200_044733 [Digitaria exilis]|uniref:asparagine synthase (glutamine-hydrolyzing) n=1 Tax=Digitaria exilis TaxID=1010633 RepID=A0A835B952_9POAL|nr:hypothetical protein HU200_044733 [Digitaria exilis]
MASSSTHLHHPPRQNTPPGRKSTQQPKLPKLTPSRHAAKRTASHWSVTRSHNPSLVEPSDGDPTAMTGVDASDKLTQRTEPAERAPAACPVTAPAAARAGYKMAGPPPLVLASHTQHEALARSPSPAMCGIFAVLGCADCSQAQRARVLACSRRQAPAHCTFTHRGPDWSGVYQDEGNFLAQQRLAVVSPLSGDQPLFNQDHTVVVVANGEIYNHKKIRKQFTGKHTFTTGSDCEVIIALVREISYTQFPAAKFAFDWHALFFLSQSTHTMLTPAFSYEEYGENFVDMLDGVFAFVLYDTRNKTFIAARDAIGVNPLYIGWGGDGRPTKHLEFLTERSLPRSSCFTASGSVWFSSEMKALNEDCDRFELFPPGHLYSSAAGGFRRWYNPVWFAEQVPAAPYDPLVLREAFEKAVIKRLMTDVPFGVLLSGGLDSSLVASVTKRHLVETEAAEKFGTELHSFVVGLELADAFHPATRVANRGALTFPFWLGSPDLKAAREVADYLGTIHHEAISPQDGIDAIEEVIYHDETYDVTTIRASTPMFLMARKIKALGVKMVLSGEGSDELLGGYLYFHFAPNKEEFHKETCRKVKALHQYDCLRANKATSAWGLEVRVPFLDKEFIDVAMGMDPEWKMVRTTSQPSAAMIDGEKLLWFRALSLLFLYNKSLGRIEKWVMRKAFDDEENPYLPKHILYRQKEQFSDGVGYSWIDGLKAFTEQQVTDEMMSNAAQLYPYNTPVNKEAYYYRMIFERLFPQDSARETVPWGPSIACSTPAAIEWVEQWKASNDPSGRFISSHDAAADASTTDTSGKQHANGKEVAVAANGGHVPAPNGAVNGTDVAVAIAA